MQTDIRSSFARNGTWSSVGPMLLVLVIAGLLVVPGEARAATIVVNTTDDPGTSTECSLRAAINNTNNETSDTNSTCLAGTSSDTINFSISNATITLGSMLPAIAHTLTIDGSSQIVTISGANLYTVLTVSSGATLNLNRLTVANGYSDSGGGGIIVDGTLAVTNSTFSHNNIPNGAGGAIVVDASGTLTVSNSTFSSNSAYNAGAIDIGSSNAVTISNSTFSGNSATGGYGEGGAIGGGGTYALTITGSTFSGNSALDGAGAIVDRSTGLLTVTNCTFSGNVAASGNPPAGLGACIERTGAVGGSIVTNSTFSDNPGCFAAGYGGSITIANSIVANSGGQYCHGNLYDGGYNIVDAASFPSCGFGTEAEPLLDPSGLQNNGGPTQTIALLSGSPAIDAVPKIGANCPATDQRGAVRPAPGHTACDAGAFEFGSSLDTTPPTISIVSPTATSYTLGELVPSAYTCTDPDDSVTVCAGPVANNANIDTASVGQKTFTVNATDSNNNSSSKSVNYSVAYNVCPLYDQSHPVKSGATLPVKLNLCDVNATDVSSSGVVVHATSVVMVSSNTNITLQDSGNANPDDDFRFDATLGTTGGYIFNLSTKGYSKGTFVLKFTAGSDPTVHSTQFEVR